MTPKDRRRKKRYSRVVVAAAALATFAAFSDARAQIAQPAFSDANFDQWVFQNHRNPETARQYMLSQLTVKAEEIDRVCELTEEQKEKLLLAGHGDLKRFFDRYHELKLRFQELKNDRNNINAIFTEIRPLQTALQSEFFHEESLLQKTLVNMLDDEQAARYGASAEDRLKFRPRAKVELTVALFERGAPLAQAQRKKLIDFLLEETRLPQRSTQYDHYVILYQLSKKPEERWKPLLSETQWKVVSQLLAQSQQMEAVLKQQGVEFDALTR